jgi:Tfp pilus assembly protein PilO
VITASRERIAELQGMERKRETRGREHELDRMVAAATYRAQRAREGKGYRFTITAAARR